MLTKLRSKLTYPYIVSTLALFLALTGGAFALQGKNTVDSGDIKKNNVKSSDIKSPERRQDRRCRGRRAHGHRPGRVDARSGPLGGER